MPAVQKKHSKTDTDKAAASAFGATGSWNFMRVQILMELRCRLLLNTICTVCRASYEVILSQVNSFLFSTYGKATPGKSPGIALTSISDVQQEITCEHKLGGVKRYPTSLKMLGITSFHPTYKQAKFLKLCLNDPADSELQADLRLQPARPALLRCS